MWKLKNYCMGWNAVLHTTTLTNQPWHFPSWLPMNWHEVCVWIYTSSYKQFPMIELLKAYGKQTRSRYFFTARKMWYLEVGKIMRHTQVIIHKQLRGCTELQDTNCLVRHLTKHIHQEVKCGVNCTPTNLFSQNFDLENMNKCVDITSNFVYMQNLIWSADY